MKSVDGKQSRFAITPRMKDGISGQTEYLIKISATLGDKMSQLVDGMRTIPITLLLRASVGKRTM